MFDLDTPEGRAAYIAECERKIAESRRQEAYAELERSMRMAVQQVEFALQVQRETELAWKRFRRKYACDHADKDTAFIYA